MSNLLLKLIKFGVGFVLFIPLYIGGSFFFPFIFPKIWLFQLVVEIIFFLYIILALADPRYRPKFNRVMGALTLLTLILIIASFTGIDAFRSFWGNTERMSGVISWLHFVALAVVLLGVIKTEKEWKNYIGIAVLVSVLEFFYVLAQYFIGYESGVMNKYGIWLPGSQSGTIGNADLIGLYANFCAFFALYLWSPTLGGLRFAHENKNFIPQGWGIWVIAFFLNMGTIFLASSRGAILGFGAGIFVYAIIGIWQKGRKTAGIWGAVFIILVSIYGALWLARNTDFVKNNNQIRRITHVSLMDTTVQQRFTEWGIAWNAFMARPIFGFGPNNYLYLHNAFINPRVYNLRETNFDRAHNSYLDYVSMSGAFGLSGYLLLIGVLTWIFWKNKLWTWVGLMAAYAVNSFFVFDSPASYIALFLTIGFASYIAGNTKSSPYGGSPEGRQIQNSNLSPQTVIAISIFYFLFSIFLIWQVSVKPTAANLNFVRSFNYEGAGLSPQEALELYKKSLQYETLGTTEFRNQYTQWVRVNIEKFPPENRLEIIQFGIAQLEQEVKDHPLVFAFLNLGQMYYFAGQGISDSSLKAELFTKAEEAYRRAIELAPKRLEVYYSDFQLALTRKDYQKGVQIIKKTVEFAPDYPQNWWYLGIAYVAAGDDDNAIRSINKALSDWFHVKEADGRLDYKIDDVLASYGAFAPKQEILGVVNPYIRQKRWKELLLLYLGIAASDPNDVQIHQSLALVYQNLGLTDKVNEELKIIDALRKK